MGFYIDLGTLGIVAVLAVLLTLALTAGRLAIWCIKTLVGSRAGNRYTWIMHRIRPRTAVDVASSTC